MNSFDDIPEDKEESYPCPACEDGNLTENSDGSWSCDNGECQYVAGEEVR